MHALPSHIVLNIWALACEYHSARRKARSGVQSATTGILALLLPAVLTHAHFWLAGAQAPWAMVWWCPLSVVVGSSAGCSACDKCCTSAVCHYHNTGVLLFSPECLQELFHLNCMNGCCLILLRCRNGKKKTVFAMHAGAMQSGSIRRAPGNHCNHLQLRSPYKHLQLSL